MPAAKACRKGAYFRLGKRLMRIVDATSEELLLEDCHSLLWEWMPLQKFLKSNASLVR